MEKKPHHPRRMFFRRAASEFLALIGELKGTPSFKLESLWKMRRSTLGKVVPRIRENVSLKGNDKKQLFAQIGDDSKPTFLFDVTSQNSFLFNMIDSINSIDAVTEKTAQHFNISDQEAFEKVRAFFLDLVKQGVCVPVNRVGESVLGIDDWDEHKLKPITRDNDDR